MSARSLPTLPGHRRLVAILAGLVLAGSLVGIGLPRAAQASCGPLTTKSVSGTLSGADGRSVNAVIGFTYVDLYGTRLDARGCRLQGDAYGRVVTLNAGAPATGIASSPAANRWSIDRIPANVKEIWVETYPKGADGKTNYSHYTGVYRPRVLPGTQNVNLVFPVVCGQPGGTTGAVAATVTIAGRPVAPDWMGWWSESPTSAQMGYALGKGSGNGFVSPPLTSSPSAPGKPQNYRVNMYYKNRFIWRGAIPVYPCRTTRITINER